MTDPPFDGRIESGAVWGRGALDTKASMGVMLTVLEQMHLAGEQPGAGVWLVGTAGEEAGGLIGALRFEQWLNETGHHIDEMIIAEPTEFRPLHGHKGGVALKLTTHGRAAHTAVPELGENAIEAMVQIVTALVGEHERLGSLDPTTELGNATLTVSTIEGGKATNIVPDRCTITASQRLVPGQDPTAVYDRIVAIATDASPLPVTAEPIRPAGTDERGTAAFYQPADTAFVQQLARWADTTPTVAPFGTNAMRYTNAADAMAVFGPGSIDDAHLATEQVAIADLQRLANVYLHWLAE